VHHCPMARDWKKIRRWYWLGFLPVVAIVNVYIQFFTSHEPPWSLLFPAFWLFFALGVALPTGSSDARDDLIPNP
jgi:hypothetical protein